MIDLIKQQFQEGMSVDQKLNVTREFLQILTLKIMYDKQLFKQVAFLGGTSLRILYDLKRFSEDLDFSVIEGRGYDFDKIHQLLSKSFELYTLPFEVKVKSTGSVHSLMMKFRGLLKELGLSNLQDQKLSIKFEIDSNPPEGYNVVNTLVTKTYVINIVHYDLPSLFAGKLHACFHRKFIKGRDFYDFIWYLGKKIKPNFLLLNNAIKQTQGKNAGIDETNLKDFLLRRIERVDFEIVKKDVERFLDDKSELSLFEREAIQGAIESTY